MQGVKGTSRETTIIKIFKEHAKNIRKYFPRMTNGRRTSYNNIFEYIIKEKESERKAKELLKSKEQLLSEIEEKENIIKNMEGKNV